MQSAHVMPIFLALHNQGKKVPRCRSWLRHCAKSREVAGSIPDGIIEIFH